MAEAITYEILTGGNVHGVREFIAAQFLPRSASCRAVGGIAWAEAEGYTETVIANSIQHGLSLVALNSEREVVGLRLTTIITRDEDTGTASTDITDEYAKQAMAKMTPKMQILLKYIHVMEGDMWSLVPADVHTMAKFLVVATHERYVRRGIAETMVKRAMRLAKENACQAVIVDAAAWRSQRMYAKLEFDELKRVEHADFLDEHGEPYLNCDDGTTCGILMFNRI